MAFPSTVAFPASSAFPAVAAFPASASYPAEGGLTPQPEIFTIQCAGHDADSYTGGVAYFLFWLAAGQTYEGWLNWDSQFSPPGVGTVSVEMALTPGGTADDVAEVIRDRIDALPEWSATRSGTLVTVTASSTGVRTPDAVDVDTGLTITTTQQGS